MDKNWAHPPLSREQHVLFPLTLDEIVPANHPIRLLDALLALCDWTQWEMQYDGHRGQPPIHPRLMAGCLLYGLTRGCRSSRELEDATRERKDFMWFLEGRSIDHATFAKFRTAFEPQLKELHRQLARMICEQYEDALVELVLDGTRERANSDRHGARTAQAIERTLERIAGAIDRKMDEMARTDRDEQHPSSLAPTPAFQQMEAFEQPARAPVATGDNAQDNAANETSRCGTAQPVPVKSTKETARLQKEIERLRAKETKLQRALEIARERDAIKKKNEGKNAKATRVPVTDADSYIQPNKDGGYAPNYTPALAVDGASGAILYADVPPGADEGAVALPAVQEAQALGVAPQRLLADGNVLTGKTMQELERQGIAVYAPTGTDFSASNPANRPELCEPVAESQCEQLPRRAGLFSQAAFVYDSGSGHYYCPSGQVLAPLGNGEVTASGIHRQKYVCPGKQGCPYANECVPEKTQARTVVRDEYQDTRDEIGRRMATPEGRAVYKRRAPAVEVAFARIKHQMGIRQFLLRGLDKVRMEWSWICAAYNLNVLLRMAKTGAIAPGKSRDASVRKATGAEILVLAFPERVSWAGTARLPQAA